MYEAKLEFPGRGGGWGVQNKTKKPFHGVRMDIFWAYHAR